MIPFVRKDSYLPNKKMVPLVIGNGYTTDWDANGLPPVYETVTGNPVSFSTVQAAPLRQLKVAFSPVQSLNGYDSPWPAGGGKNKLSIDPSIVTKTQKGVTFTVNRNSAGDVTSIVANGTADSRTYFDLGHYNISGGTILNGCPAGGGMQAYGLAIDGTAVADYGSGSTIESDLPNAWLLIVIAKDYVCNNLTFKPMVRLSSVSDATFAPYSNECPISGWSSLTVEQRGKNLFDKDDSSNIINGYINSVGKFTSASTEKCVTAPLASGTYTISKAITTRFTVAKFPSLPQSGETGTVVNTNPNETKVTFTVNDGEIVLCFIYNNTGETSTFADVLNTVQIELGTTPAPYVPYNPSSRSISISLGQTVYSGYVDVISGVLTVDMGIVDLGTLTWVLGQTATSGIYRITSSGIRNAAKRPASTSIPANILCESYQTLSADNVYQKITGIGLTTGSGDLSLYDAEYNTADKLDAFVASLSGVQLVYELATPIPIQLTPQEVSSLLGENVMWSDANGDLTVEYRSN